MQYDEFDINLAENARLLTDFTLDNRVYPKGHAMTKEDIIVFKLHGIRTIMAAVMEDSDISCQTAMGIIAAKLCGENTAYVVDEEGVCQIVAVSDGVFINSEDRDAKFNRLHPDVILNTIQPYAQVKKDEVIASLEITSPLMVQDEVDDIIFRLSGNVPLLQVAEPHPRKTALIYTRLEENRPSARHFTGAVKKLLKTFVPLGFDFIGEYNSDYTPDSLDDALETALKAGYEVIFILGALRGGGSSDVIPTALAKVVDDIVSPHISQIGASDLLIAVKNQSKIIALPYEYETVDTSMINRYIMQALFNDKLNKFDFERNQPPVLKAGTSLNENDKSGLIAGKNGPNSNQANIAAVVLAAGIGSRSGRNKLMVEMEDGLPLFMRAVNAAVGSEASPVFVITGYHDEEMQAFLENVDVNILYNPSYRAGVKTSLALGLKSIPSFCAGAVIIPADMPNLTADDINKLIKCFKLGIEKQVCMFSHEGIKANPIIWSSGLFEQADIVPENADVRPVFMEHADYTTLIEVKDTAKLLDVNFPSDIEKVLKE